MNNIGKYNFLKIEKVLIRNFSLYSKKNKVFTVEEKINNAVYCLAGANGLGKTTFLNIINYCLTGLVLEPQTLNDNLPPLIMKFLISGFQRYIFEIDLEYVNHCIYSFGGVLDVNVSNPDVQTLIVGSYVYICNNTGVQNYTNASATRTLIVSVISPPAPSGGGGGGPSPKIVCAENWTCGDWFVLVASSFA